MWRGRLARGAMLSLAAAAWLLAFATPHAAAQAGEPQTPRAAVPEVQAPPGQQPAAAQNEYVPVRGLPPSQEQLPAAGLVMTAYGFVWAVLLVYVWTVWRRLTKVEREIKDLAARIGARH